MNECWTVQANSKAWTHTAWYLDSPHLSAGAPCCTPIPYCICLTQYKVLLILHEATPPPVLTCPTDTAQQHVILHVQLETPQHNALYIALEFSTWTVYEHKLISLTLVKLHSNLCSVPVVFSMHLPSIYYSLTHFTMLTLHFPIVR